MGAFVGSGTLCHVVTKNMNIAERNLQIDLFARSVNFQRWEPNRIARIPDEGNPADMLREERVRKGHAKGKLIMKKNLNTKPIGWVIGE